MLVGYGGYAGGGPNAEHQSSWAKRLTDWGYVALQVDSYSPRGPSLNCDFSGSLTISHDAFAAKAYLSTLPFVDQEEVVVAGWSIGGAAVLKAIDRYFRDKGVSPFKAAVAFYPVCYPVYDPDTPLLLLSGRKDDLCTATAAEGLKRKYLEGFAAITPPTTRASAPAAVAILPYVVTYPSGMEAATRSTVRSGSAT